MKIICTQENLNSGLAIVNRITTQNANLPILNNILLETKRGQLRLAATNLETGINYFIRGKVKEEGSITIPATLLTNYINSLEGERVVLETEDEALKIQTKNNKAKIKGLSASDFPFQYNLVGKMKKGKKFIVQEKDLRKGIEMVSFAAAFGELRPEIAGVFMRFTGRSLTLTATDSYRLAEKKTKLETAENKAFAVIVPIKAVQELLHILEDNEEEVRIFFIEGQVLFQVRAVDFTAQLIEGQYPDYKQIIPRDLSTKVRAETPELIQAIKRVSFFAAHETNDVKITIDPQNEKLVIFAETSQAGSGDAEIRAEVTGERQEVVYNHRYLLEGLTNIATKKVLFETNGQEEPGILRPAGENGSFLYLIMPIRS